MKTAGRAIVAGLSALVLAGALSVSAADWPQWRGPGRDAKVSDFTAPQAWPAALTQKWKVTVGPGDATPALVGDRVYAFSRQGGDEVTSCLNAATGEQIWQDKYAPAVTGPAARHPGPRSSPAVAEGKVVTLGVNGVLSCLDADGGKLVWRKDPYPGVVPKYFTGLSPMIVDGMAIAHLGRPGNGALMAFDLGTGEVKWKWDAEGPAYASPMLMTAGGVRQVVTMTEKSVVGVALSDGKLLWTVPFPVTGMAYNAATPIIDGDVVIYTGQNRGTHAVRIVKQADAFTATPLWDNPDVGVQFSTPVLDNGLLFGLSDRGVLFCLDAKTGKTDWVDTTKRGGNFAAIVGAGPVILALPSTSELIAYRAEGTKFDELARIKVADTATYAYPVIAGDRIFVRDQDSVILYTLGS
jgi:outer membrane protein assembly factor BamB